MSNTMGSGTATLAGTVNFALYMTSYPGSTPAGGTPFVTYTSKAGTFGSWSTNMPTGWTVGGVFHQITSISVNGNGFEYDVNIS